MGKCSGIVLFGLMKVYVHIISLMQYMFYIINA